MATSIGKIPRSGGCEMVILGGENYQLIFYTPYSDCFQVFF